MHGLLVPSLDHRASMQSSRSSCQLGKPSRPSTHRHRRDSSISTSASISSNHTRVLPFATAAFGSHRLQPISAASPIPIRGIPETPEEQPQKPAASPPRIRIGGQAKSLEHGGLYYPALGHPRFALAQPRRVVTVNGPAAMPTAKALLADMEPSGFVVGSNRAPGARNKRRSIAIGISSMLPAGPAAAVSNNSVASSSGGGGGLGGTRARPIIGLGLTLNPADTLVTLQTRCRRNAQPRAVTDPQAVVAELARCADTRAKETGAGCAEKRHGESSCVSGSPDAAKTPASSTGSSASDGVLFDLALLSPLDIMKSCVSLAESPRNLDPELVSIAGRMHHRSPTTSAPVAEDVQVVPLSPADARPADEPEEPRISEHEQAVDGRRQRSACCLQKPSGPEPLELTCLLCFERVLVPRKRTAAMRCPGCLVPLV